MEADETEEKCVGKALAALDRCERLVRLSRDPSETRAWQNHDLASLIENRLGVIADVDGASEEQRNAWVERVTSRGDLGLADPHSSYRVPFWIVGGGKRVGTIAVSTGAGGSGLLQVSSVRVRPQDRGQGHAWSALRKVYDAALTAQLSGIRLSTEWSWQPSVRFYLRIGMWVRSWKRALDFYWHRDVPPWRLEHDGELARFVVVLDGIPRTLIRARRNDERLEWVEEPALASTELGYEAPGTLALALAVSGFPLITSNQAWQRQLEQGFSDFGGPEGLAFKIRRFEAWDRKQGWRVDTPRIPGLDYPDWDAVD